MTEKKVGDGFLLGEQSTDYFDFVCGYCGRHITRITVDDVDAVGFWFSAKCQECGKGVTLKITARWGKALSPHIRKRWREKEIQMRKSNRAQGK